jgi:hypothetical protein
MEDLRFFAILNENNVVINIVTFPKEDIIQISADMDKKCIWVFNGDTWENRAYSYYYVDFYDNIGDVNFVEEIIGDPQVFLNENFPNSLINDIIIVESELPIEEEIVISPISMLKSYPDGSKLIEYSYDESLTDGPVSVGEIYDEEKNIFYRN